AGTGGAGVEAVGAHAGHAVQLVGQGLHQALGGELGDPVGAPVGAALAADAAGGEHHGGVVGQLEQRQQGAGQHEHGVDVDLHDAHEVVAGQLFQRRARADDGGVVQQAVEAAELGFDGGGQLVVLVRQGGFQVEGDHHRLRMAGGLDLVIDLVEVLFGLAQQQHGGAVGGEGPGGGGADAAAGAGDQDHAALEQVGAGAVVEHGGISLLRESDQQLHRARSSTARSSRGWSTTTSAPQWRGLSSGWM